jgi:DNA repair exonuclease SbcCD ATPase subunit
LDQEFEDDDWQTVPPVSAAEGPQKSTGSQAFPQQTQLTNLDEAIRQQEARLWELEEESVPKQSELDAQIHLQKGRLSQLLKEMADAERTIQQLQQQQQSKEELQRRFERLSHNE